MSEGFFDRWSRRKQEARVEPAPPEVIQPPVAAGAPTGPVASPSAAIAEVPPPTASVAQPPQADAPPPPNLADTDSLTIDSDFKPFLAQNVAPEVKNAAFKKLFADPHFNVMDGLDIYIDDYSIPSPLPESVLRQMASAKFLNLFTEEEEPPSEGPKDGTHAVPPQDVAQSEPSGELPSPPVAPLQPASQETDDHHADLRLQPDHAARSESDREGTG